MGRSVQVAVSCAVCSTEFTVKPSRAAQSKAITCSAACIGELRRRNRINACGSAKTRTARCATCGTGFERKPSQLAKYARSYCSRACSTAAKRGPKPELRNGQWVACEICGSDVWRTPATRRSRTYCSRSCAGKAPRSSQRVERVVKHCATCREPMIMLPHDAKRYRFCSSSCAAIEVQGRKRGQPGTPWSAAQRATLSATLLEKYRHEWAAKAERHSERMSGVRNPQWRDGAALKPYTRGFTDRLKWKVAERDGNCCRICGAPRGRGTHVVHHIDGEKHNHDESNLVLLCRPCHGSLHAGMAVLDL